MLRRDCNHVRLGRRAPRLQAIAAVALAICVAPPGKASGSPQGGAAASYRIFLTDGTPLVSFGGFARVSGRVVFTIPIGSPASPDRLQVVTLPDSVVDWERTDRYTDAVRHQHYASTRGEDDYAALTGAVARALGEIAFAASASTKLAIAADIRRQLLEWPAAHLAYRSADVRELTAHVEEAISEIRAASGQRTFDLSLVAMIEPPSEPLLPEPQLKDSLDYARAVAQMTDSRRERLSLQESILAVLERRKPLVPRDWYSATRKTLVWNLERERELDHDYGELASRTLRDARKRQQDADVAALERLAAAARKKDARLGYQRPETMQALLASLSASTEKAREQRLAMDRYEYRQSTYSSYHHRIDDSLGKFDDVSGDLGAVRALSGLSGRRLSRAEKRVSAIEVSLLPAEPPAELRVAHDLLFVGAADAGGAQAATPRVGLRRHGNGPERIGRGGRRAAAVRDRPHPHRRVLPTARRPVITPRLTRIVRVPDLASFRQVILDRATEGTLADIRRRAIIVPSHAGAEQLRRTIEDHQLVAGPRALVMPSLLTRDDWRSALHDDLSRPQRSVDGFEREVLLQAAARAAIADGVRPPFTVRPGLITAMLGFYDGVRRHGRTVIDFERVAVTALSRDIDTDRGAVRMLDQTRFLVAAFRRYEALLADCGLLDEHGLTASVLAAPASRFSHVIVAVGDRAGDASGLWPSDFDLLTRVAGLSRLEVVATHAVLGAGLLERLRRWLPGHEDCAEVPFESPQVPRLAAPAAGDAVHWRARDREEELAAIARQTKRDHRRHPDAPLSRTAVVFKRPLPYVYPARQIFSSAGVPHQAFDTLPLAAEPYAAALDLVFDAVDSAFARTALIGLLRSPLFVYRVGGRPITPAALAQFDRQLSEARYLAEPAELARFARERSSSRDLQRAASAAAAVADELASLSADGTPTGHLDTVIRFLDAHERRPRGPSPVVERHLRVRSAVLAALARLREAHARFDDAPRPFADTVACVHRWIEQQTFAPREGATGVQLLDADSARFGEFDTIHLVGLTQQEWPESVARSIFYPASMLQDLHWPEDADARAAERARFDDLLHAAARQVRVSTITLEHDSLVEPSPFLDDLANSGLVVERVPLATQARIFAAEAILRDPQRPDVLGEPASAWLALRQGRTPADDRRFHGQGDAAPSAKYRVSTIDQYLACPFVYFSTRILRLAEEPEDEEALGPRAQGTLVHEVLQAFFECWQGRGGGAITAANLDDARAQFSAIAEKRLATLPATDAALQRTRLLGSPVAEGYGDIVLSAEAGREAGVPVMERLLEFTLDGETVFTSGETARPVRLAAKADRVDLLADGTFRVYDYKLSRAPNRKHVAQLPAYAAAARQRLEGRHGRSWRASDAAYISFGKGSHYEPLAGDATGLAEALAAGEARLLRAVDGIEKGTFPPAPAEAYRCTYCAFSVVCRKDYVRDE